MRSRHLARLAMLLWLAVALPAAHAIETLRIDSDGSQAAFSVRLLWFHRIDGRFERLRGDVVTDSRQRAQVEAWIEVDSAQMSNARYRRWLLSRDFFDAMHYPRIHFISNPTLVQTLREGGLLHGHLSIRGVTRPVTFTVRPGTCPSTGLNDCTLRVDGSIERSHFGMHKRRGLISDTVKLDIDIHLHRPKGTESLPQPLSSAHDDMSPLSTTGGSGADQHHAAASGLRAQPPANPRSDPDHAPRPAGGGDLRSR